jgi:hypothetical protein
MARHDHILRRGEAASLGDTVQPERALVVALAAREVAPEARVACGEQTHGVEVTFRRPQQVPEVGRPAPLLMRLMRRKSTLEPGARAHVEGRERKEARAARVRPADEVRVAIEDHRVVSGEPIISPAPASPVAAPIPRGMRAARALVVGDGA